MITPDFCESNFSENRDREWDFSGKFLRVENENEIFQANFWELRMRMRVLSEKLRVKIESETLGIPRMRVPWWESRVRSLAVTVIKTVQTRKWLFSVNSKSRHYPVQLIAQIWGHSSRKHKPQGRFLAYSTVLFESKDVQCAYHGENCKKTSVKIV